MSVEASAWAWKQIIPPNPKYVLIALADWYNELESCAWPSNQKLCEKTGLSRRTVQRSLSWLRDNHLVIPEARFKDNKQLSNRYRLPVGALYLQGCHSDAPRGVTLTQGGCHSDAPIEDTLKDTVEDTLVTTASSDQSDEGDEMNVDDVVKKFSEPRSKKEIFDRFKLTPKGCADLWIDCHAASGEHGKGVLPSNAASSVLKNTAAKLDDDIDFRVVVWKVMHDWVGFGKMCESHAGAPGYPMNPAINYFTKHIETAVNFAKAEKPVQSIAKPLTKQPAPCTPKPKAKKQKISVEELLAMNEDDE